MIGPDAPRAPPLGAVLGLFSAGFIGWTLLLGAHGGSYADYLSEWREILAGHDPWRPAAGLPFNAYGPLFNALAALAAVHPLAPKVLFALAYCGFAWWLIARIWPARAPGLYPWPLILLCLANPYVWISVAHFGMFDVLAGLAAVAGVHLAGQGRAMRAGAALAAGILLKLVPLVILPFLVIGRGQIGPRLALACAGVTLAGFTLSYLIWGPSTFAPFTFAGTRGPVHSVYILVGADQPELAAWLSRAALAAMGLALICWCTLRRTDPALSALMAVLGTLLFYQVGYNNYQMMLLPLAAYWLTLNWVQLRQQRGLLSVFAAYFISLALIDMLFPVLRRVLAQPLAFALLDALCLLRFAAGCALLLALARYSPPRGRARVQP